MADEVFRKFVLEVAELHIQTHLNPNMTIYSMEFKPTIIFKYEHAVNEHTSKHTSNFF